MEAQARRGPVSSGLTARGGHRAGPTAETLKVWEALQGRERALAVLAHRSLFTPGKANICVQADWLRLAALGSPAADAGR